MNKIITAFAIAFFLTLAAASYSDGVQRDLQSGVIRLHIIADSNSEADQTVKLAVRDAILSETREKLQKNSIGESRESITKNLGSIENIADRVLQENGFTYTANAAYGKFSFPEKSYGNITLPAGEYYGVKVVLGSGSGNNWWCVMYPPLCFTENGPEMSGEGAHTLRQGLADDTYDIITGETVVKFRIVEAAQEIKQLVQKQK